MFAMIFAMMFVGSTPMITVANAIAEDNEYKSLRFLVMAGVKPPQYILGLGLFTMVMSILPILAFGWMAGLEPNMYLTFIPIALLGCVASLILGGVVGIFSKNVQQCSAIYTPLMLVLNFMPFLAQFTPGMGIYNISQFLFTHQIVLIFHGITGSHIDTAMSTSFIILAANVLVFLVLFILAYKKKGLKG